MPKVKDLEKCKHPNSRKTKALVKQMKKQATKQASKNTSILKQNLVAEKFLWFRDQLDDNQEKCSAAQLEDLILQYLARFDEELEQIKIKHSIGQRNKNRQHASREDIINMTLKNEKEEFKSCGIELPDLLNIAQFKLLKLWKGEIKFLQNFKIKRFSLKFLEDLKKQQQKNSNNQLDLQNLEIDKVRKANEHVEMEVEASNDKK